MKSVPHMLGHILNDDFEMGCDFLLCWACVKIGYSLAKHAQSNNWYSLSEHARKSFWRTTCIFRVFPLFPPVTHSSFLFSCPCLMSFVPSLTPLYFISHPMFPVPCLPSSVPCVRYLFRCPQSYVSDPCPILYPLPHGSAPCLPFSVPCLTWSVPCLPSSFLHPLTPINCPSVPLCGSIPLFLSFAQLFPVLCSFIFRHLSLVFHTYYSNFFTCRRGLLSWFQLLHCSRRRQINITKVLISSYKITQK